MLLRTEIKSSTSLGVNFIAWFCQIYRQYQRSKRQPYVAPLSKNSLRSSSNASFFSQSIGPRWFYFTPVMWPDKYLPKILIQSITKHAARSSNASIAMSNTWNVKPSFRRCHHFDRDIIKAASPPIRSLTSSTQQDSGELDWCAKR